jgi:hypothetical protein
MRPTVLILPLAVFTFGLLWFSRDVPPRVRPESPIHPSWPPVGEKAAYPGGVTPEPATLRAAIALSTTPTSTPPAPASVGTAPRLVHLPETDGIQTGLVALGPDARPILEYKLALLHDLARCLEVDTVATGSVRAFFHFVAAPDGAMLPTTVEILDSTLPEEQDPAVFECLVAAHTVSLLELGHPPAEPEFSWATRIAFPLDNDFVYRFIRADGAITR